jgi:hypothetical protein
VHESSKAEIARVGDIQGDNPPLNPLPNAGAGSGLNPPLNPPDKVAVGFWEADIEDRIRAAGRRYFNADPGSARVSLLLSPAGELLALDVTGPAAGMAEHAIRSVQRWPRFNGEQPRRFSRVVAFVVVS